MSNFLSGAAVMLSMIALLFSGFAVYQVFEMQQTLTTVSNSQKPTTATSNLSPVNPAPSPSDTNPSPTASTTTLPSATLAPSATPQATVIPNKQLVQPVVDSQAQIELVAVKRIQDPQTGRQDIVNVLMRVHRLADNLPTATIIPVRQTTARNVTTNEIYKSVNSAKSSTEKVVLSGIRKGAFAEAYVWLKVPPEVNTLDILVPKAGEFKNVSVSN